MHFCNHKFALKPYGWQIHDMDPPPPPNTPHYKLLKCFICETFTTFPTCQMQNGLRIIYTNYTPEISVTFGIGDHFFFLVWKSSLLSVLGFLWLGHAGCGGSSCLSCWVKKLSQTQTSGPKCMLNGWPFMCGWYNYVPTWHLRAKRTKAHKRQV